jgi:capsule polysaccharide export protein KpsC/LpsZ
MYTAKRFPKKHAELLKIADELQKDYQLGFVSLSDQFIRLLAAGVDHFKGFKYHYTYKR